MTLDPVHGLQSAFRSLMRVMAYPGTLCDISSQCAGLDLELGFPRPLLVLALTLLDAETRFAVLSAERPEHESLLSRLTFARRSPVSAADFVFVAGPGFPAAEALLEARIGTLVDPHLGATIVMEAASLSKGEAFELSGPGIEARAPTPGGPRSLLGGVARPAQPRVPAWTGPGDRRSGRPDRRSAAHDEDRQGVPLMGYVAVRGGTEAIERSIERLRYERLRKGLGPGAAAIEAGMRGLVDQVMSEASLYSEAVTACAIKQAEGSPEEAVFLVRAFRSTLPRRHYSLEIASRSMIVERRISATSRTSPAGRSSALPATTRIASYRPRRRARRTGAPGSPAT